MHQTIVLWLRHSLTRIVFPAGLYLLMGSVFIDVSSHPSLCAVNWFSSGLVLAAPLSSPDRVEPKYLSGDAANRQLSILSSPEKNSSDRVTDLRMFSVGGFFLGGGLCALVLILLGRAENCFKVRAGPKQDVTENTDVEESLRRIQRRLEFVLNASPAVTYIARTSGDFGATFVSNNVEKLCGYPALRFTESHSFWADHIHDEDRDRVFRETESIIKKGRFQSDYRFLHANGNYLWIHDQAYLVRDGQGNPLEIIGSWSDITARQEALIALQASEERFGVAFKCNPGAMAIISLDNNAIMDTNDSFLEMFDLKEEEVIRKTPEELGLFEDGAFFRKVMKNIWPDSGRGRHENGERVSGVEAGFRRSNGEIGSCLFSSAFITIEQKPCLLAVLSDISRRNRAEKEKRELEKQLRQSQKLEAIGTLAGGIAHDFNNILSVIIGYSELAMEATSDPHLQSDLGEVIRGGQRARELITQILAFSRQSEQEMVPIRLKLVIEEVLALLKASLPSYIDIRKKIDCDAMILGDATQIHQVLMNLCTNASHAMPDGGTLEVTLAVCPHEQVMEMSPELMTQDYVVLRISDTGRGMPPEVMGRIFEPYFTTRKKGHGTGLGLSVVHGIVKKHGGDIRVSSASGKGSTFQVYLPVHHGFEEEEPHVEPSPPGGSERILFVDDEPALVSMVKRVLESLGYQVTTRTSSLEALELFKSRPNDFHLLITDMTMPHMTGEVLIGAVSQIRHDIPAIICTGFSEKLTDQNAEKIGARAFVYKPILKKEIAEVIRQVLDG